MDTSLILTILSTVIGGLGIFLLGMKYMSEGLQAVSGEQLRKIIGMATSNRFFGVLVGLGVTCVVQSSSVTTVMVVGFVNSGIMTLMQAIGVILGANIGTTLTGWILVLEIGKYGLPILGISAFFFLFSKRERIRYIGMTILGIGMVFFGLELMKNGFKPLRTMPEFTHWVHAFAATSYWGIIKCAAVGCILTMIVQSSSAMLGITIGLASTGAIEFQTAAALVMGENIGTTVTAMLASIGTNTTARRAALAHVIFNVIGTSWFIALFPIAIKGITSVIAWKTGFDPTQIHIDAMDDKEFGLVVTAGIALTHTSFNVVNVLIFLTMVGLLAKIVTKLVPEKSKIEPTHLTYLDVRMLDTPSLGIVQSQNQIEFMGETVETMMSELKSCLTDMENSEESGDKLFLQEEILDNVQKEIFLFLSHLVSGQVPVEVSENAHRQMRLADEFESLSDYAANVLKGMKKLQKNKMTVEGPSLEKLLVLHERVANYITRINQMVKMEDAEQLVWATSEGIAITALMKESRREHLDRLQKEKLSPYFSLTYTDMLNYYRRMKDHALNIAEVVAGEK